MLLLKNKHIMDKVIQQLLEVNVLTGEEVAKLLGEPE
jgi:hypothetical protein